MNLGDSVKKVWIRDRRTGRAVTTGRHYPASQEAAILGCSSIRFGDSFEIKLSCLLWPRNGERFLRMESQQENRDRCKCAEHNSDNYVVGWIRLQAPTD